MTDIEPYQRPVVALLAAVGETDGAEWAAPTPCHGWSVADLARHLVAGERAFTIALGGTTYDLAALTAEAAAIAEVDLSTAYADAAADLRTAAALLPADARVPTLFGDVAPGFVTDLRALEAVAHGHDLTVALARPAPSYDASLEPLVDAADRMRAALDRARPGNTAFAPAHDPGPGATPLQRVLARLGR